MSSSDPPAAASAAAVPSASSGSSLLSRAVGPIRQPKGSFRQALPAWSAAPVPPYHALYCEVYDTPGIILETRHLSGDGARAHAFGRHAEWCDQVVAKLNSTSRQHAAVVHTKTGPVLLDLFSAHGTTLNNTKLLPGQPYTLFEGDIVRFGGAGSYYKFKGTGRPKREEKDLAVVPIAAPAGYKIDSEETPTADAAAAGASTVAESASAGEKRKQPHERDSESASRKDARGEGGSRHSGSNSGLANPKGDRIRCRHLLVKHTKSRRPSSWRADPVTLTLAEARSKLEKLRAELIAGNPSAAELESRFCALAQVESDCSSAKMQGDLGFFEYKKMQPPFSAAAFKLRVGDLSPLVETDSGVHIIWRKE
jgi:NIMA-interacting peptidyl-prolyl cis-trans isomerase 1